MNRFLREINVFLVCYYNGKRKKKSKIVYSFLFKLGKPSLSILFRLDSYIHLFFILTQKRKIFVFKFLKINFRR